MTTTAMCSEISFDLIMTDHMSFVEGAYRLFGEDNWHPFIVSRRSVERPEIRKDLTWKSGATGVQVLYPRWENLNKEIVMKILGDCFSVAKWQEVKGPDSMALR